MNQHVTLILLLQRVQQVMIDSIHVISMFPLVDTMVLDCSIGKKCNFIHYGFMTEISTKCGKKIEEEKKKDQFQQSYLLASWTHKICSKAC